MRHIYGPLYIPQHTTAPAPHRYQLRVVLAATERDDDDESVELMEVEYHEDGLLFEELLCALTPWADKGPWGTDGCAQSFDPAHNVLLSPEGDDGVSYELHLNPYGPDRADPSFDFIRVLCALSASH